MQNETVKFAAKITPAQVREALNNNEKRKCPILPNHIVAKDGHCSYYHACPHRDDERCIGKSEKPILKINEGEKVKTKKNAEAGTPQDTTKATEGTSQVPEPKVTFPASIRINDYGFIGMRKSLLEALSWSKGMALRLEKNQDGSVTVRKA